LVYVESQSNRFLDAVSAHLACGRTSEVYRALDREWTPERLAEMLGSDEPDVLVCACRCLGMIGEMSHCNSLAGLLRHARDDVSSAAEQALWTIWARQGSARARELLHAASRLVEESNLADALALTERAVALDPRFAEAHHQCALVLHSIDQAEAAAESYRAALRLNPHHFAAAAGLGHLCAAEGDLAGALRWYRMALSLHPKLEELREMVPQIEAALRRRSVA
jgi:tetratricopeptide (TPR) repeat protein